MIELSLPAKKVTHLAQVDVVSDVTLNILIKEQAGDFHTHEINLYERQGRTGEFIGTATVFVRIPSVITKESFLQMWLYLILDRTKENSDNRCNTRRLEPAGRIITPANLGYPSIVLVSADAKTEWCLSTTHLVWPKRRDDKLPMVRKNGVRIVQTTWPVRDVWTNFGLTQEQLCVELWDDNKDCLARYFCPFNNYLSRDQVAQAHLNIPFGVDIFDSLINEWDDREKFRLSTTVFGSLLFMTSIDGELKAIASGLTHVPRALDVIKVVFSELLRKDPDMALIFRETVTKIMFSQLATVQQIEQQLLLLCFNVVEAVTRE